MPTRGKPKRVVYLWGAGATHAEAQRLGGTTSLLMRDTDAFGDGITTRILKRTDSDAASSFNLGEGADIEKLISLLAASGNESHFTLAELLRVNYFKELRSSLARTNLLDDPQLAIHVLRMHKDAKFTTEVESLSGIITTNHDGLLQVASQHVFGGLNPGFAFSSRYFKYMPQQAPPILQLHGSFTWKFGVPIAIERLQKNSQPVNAIWIPPTILKESKSYPFNKLTGLAYEMLAGHCDVLRIIGTSLTQNDWNILSLIFNAQQHKEKRNEQAFLIELIIPHDAGEAIKKECGYLKNLTSIGYLTEGQFADYKDDPTPIPPESDLANPFAYWLNEKLEFHRFRHELEAPDNLTFAQTAEPAL